MKLNNAWVLSLGQLNCKVDLHLQKTWMHHYKKSTTNSQMPYASWAVLYNGCHTCILIAFLCMYVWNIHRHHLNNISHEMMKNIREQLRGLIYLMALGYSTCARIGLVTIKYMRQKIKRRRSRLSTILKVQKRKYNNNGGWYTSSKFVTIYGCSYWQFNSYTIYGYWFDTIENRCELLISFFSRYYRLSLKLTDCYFHFPSHLLF